MGKRSERGAFLLSVAIPRGVHTPFLSCKRGVRAPVFISHFMKQKIKIAIVEDQKLFRDGLISLLNEYGVFEFVIQSNNGAECIESLKIQRPDIILLDLEMPVMDGWKTTDYLNKNHPEIKIIILTQFDDAPLIIDLIKRGANSFLVKNADVQKVVDAIFLVIKSGFYFDERIQAIISDEKNHSQLKFNLSDREMEVVLLLCKEFTNKEISDKLSISQRTVEGHRKNAMRKLNVKNTVGLVRFVMENNLHRQYSYFLPD